LSSLAPCILVVDDDPDSLAALEALVAREGFDVVTAVDLAEAEQRAAERAPAAILVDYHLPDGPGLLLIERLAEPRPEIVLVTGRATVETAVEALRAGATDYLTKPVDVARLKAVLESAAKASVLRSELRELREELRELGRFGAMIGSSKPMQEIYDLIARVAPTDATVLVTGESGTGKELVALTVHRLSRRAHRPFVAINCGAISAGLIESELFGHERGAFTGADRQRKGVFERAHQGTLMLDEISEMPIELQVKLLRVLETGTFTRVGGERQQTADVRIVAASNRDLEAAVAEGKLRADLLYRLRVMPIVLPPLRERGGDVRALANYFLDELVRSEGTAKTFSEEALSALETYPFPGNVRELRNTVHQAYILAEETIRPEHLPTAVRPGTAAASAIAAAKSGGPAEGDGLRLEIPLSLAEAERRVILSTLERLNGDKGKAAESLGISLKTLYSRLREYAAREAAV
jgi:DNA-binding NtrC family response regulator